MRIKSFIISLLVFLFLSSLVMAQRGNRMSVEDQMKQYNERLNLDEDQSEAIEKILTESREKMMDARDEIMADGGDYSGMREIMTKINDEKNKEVMELLNDEQKKEFEKMNEERRKEREERRRNRDY